MRRAWQFLATYWYGIKSLAGTGRARAVLWHAPWFIGAAVQIWGAGAQMGRGDYHHAVTSAVLGALLVLWPIYERYSFRGAWADGFLEGMFSIGGLYQGSIPEPLLRQTMTGDVAPEPWDPKKRTRPRHGRETS